MGIFDKNNGGLKQMFRQKNIFLNINYITLLVFEFLYKSNSECEGNILSPFKSVNKG